MDTDKTQDGMQDGQQQPNGKKATAPKKARRGLGRLYKRDAQGKEIPANSHKAGTFWIAWREGGQRKRQRLEIDGQAVTDLETAKKEQLRLRAPYLTGQRLEVLKSVEADIRRLEGIQEQQKDMADPPMRLADAWQGYMDAGNRRENGEGTRGCYLAIWRRFLEWLASKHADAEYMRDVTEAVAEEYMGELRKLEWTGNTYNKHLGFLKLIYRLLARQARVDRNPFADIVRRKQIPNSKRAMTLEEMIKVVDATEGEMRTMLVIGASTGMRLGDCATLRWDNIDLQAGVIRRKPNKTLNSSGKEVIIGMPPGLDKVFMTIPQPHGEYVLPDMAARYGNHSSRAQMSRKIQRILNSCGIRTQREGTGCRYHYEGKKKVYERRKRAVVEVGFHSLRHSWISRHAEKGTSPILITDTAGHNNPAMTEHYTHVSDETARQIAKAVFLPHILDASPEEIENENKRQRLLRIVQNAGGALLQKLLQDAGESGEND